MDGRTKQNIEKNLCQKNINIICYGHTNDNNDYMFFYNITTNFMDLHLYNWECYGISITFPVMQYLKSI